MRLARAITLIETLAALAIVAALAALALPAALDTSPRARLDALAADLDGALARARLLAADRGIAVTLALRPAASTPVLVLLSQGDAQDGATSPSEPNASAGAAESIVAEPAPPLWSVPLDAVTLDPRSPDEPTTDQPVASVWPDGTIRPAEPLTLRITNHARSRAFDLRVLPWSGRVELVPVNSAAAEDAR